MTSFKLNINLENTRSWMFDRQETLLTADTWQMIHVNKNIESKILICKEGLFPIVQATSTIPTSAEKLFDYLVIKLSDTCHEWNDVMYHASVLQKINDYAQISVVISDGKPLSDREDVFLQIFEKHNNGTLYEMSVGFDESQIPLTQNARRTCVRSKLHFCSKQITPISESSCRYTTIWHYDPAGWASRLLPKKYFGTIILKNLVHEHQKIQSLLHR